MAASHSDEGDPELVALGSGAEHGGGSQDSGPGGSGGGQELAAAGRLVDG